MSINKKLTVNRIINLNNPPVDLVNRNYHFPGKVNQRRFRIDWPVVVFYFFSASSDLCTEQIATNIYDLHRKREGHKEGGQC